MASSYLSIWGPVVEQIHHYLRQQCPKEGCGILAGHGQEITHFFPIPNLDDSPHSFSFEPQAYLRTIRQLREQQLEWIGVVHSHPTTEPYPSARDIANWHYPEKSYWICSLKQGHCRLSAYYIRHQQVIPIMYQIIVNR